MTIRFQALSILVLVLLAAACSAAPTIFLTPAPPTLLPTVPPSPAPTEIPSCTDQTDRTRLLREDHMSYCLLYPEEYTEVHIGTDEVCLVTRETNMMCNSALAFFNVEDAAGRSVSQVADEITERGGVVGECSALTIANEQAIVLPEVRGQDANRVFIVVHENRLYTITLLLPQDDPSSVERFEFLSNTVIGSFTFVPIAPSPDPTNAN